MEGGAGACGPTSVQVSITGVKQTSLGMERCLQSPSLPSQGASFIFWLPRREKTPPGSGEVPREDSTHSCLAAGRHGAQGRLVCGQDLVLPKINRWRVQIFVLPLEAQHNSIMSASLGTAAVGSENPVRPGSALPFGMGF